MDGRYMPLTQYCIYKALLFRCAPDFTALKVRLQIDDLPIDPSDNGLDVWIAGSETQPILRLAMGSVRGFKLTNATPRPRWLEGVYASASVASLVSIVTQSFLGACSPGPASVATPAGT